MTTDLITRAQAFAENAHGLQKRKYTDELYIVHPRRVAATVQYYDGSEAMVAAALLHDVVEDTPTTFDQLQEEFGSEVANLVWWLTDVSLHNPGNRATRKARDRDHLAAAPTEAQTIKIADMIDNTPSIVEFAPGFAPLYMQEKEQLLEVLTRAHPQLLRKANKMVQAYRHLTRQAA